MKTIHLHGSLAEQFGESFNFDAVYPRQLISALIHQIKGFQEALIQGEYHVVLGPLVGGFSIDETQVGFRMGNFQELHLIPAMKGAKDGRGAMKVVIGLALVTVAVAAVAFSPALTFGSALIPGFSGITYGGLAGLGISMALAGVSQLLTPRLDVSDYDQRQPPDERPSFLFNGAINQSQQGAAVPVVYGRLRVGSVVISSGLTAEQV